MEERFAEFKDRHALLITEIRRLSDEAVDDNLQARNRELRSILKVVARSFLRENVDSEVSEELLYDWMRRLEAA